MAEQAQTIAELRQQLAESLQREEATAENGEFQELQDRNRQLAEALEQQTATSEIWGSYAVRRRIFSRCWIHLIENADETLRGDYKGLSINSTSDSFSAGWRHMRVSAGDNAFH